MKQIIKVESFVDDAMGIDQDVRKLLKGRTDFMIQEVSMGDDVVCVIIKQISYQMWDDKNEKWVILPNPTQPKIEGISINDEEEGVNSDE